MKPAAAHTYYCHDCRVYVPPEAVRAIVVQRVEMLACPTCGRGVAKELSRTVEPFGPRILGALAYPFRLDVLAAAIAVALFAAAFSYLRPLAFFGFAAECALGVLVLRTAAVGRDKLPFGNDDLDEGAFGFVRPAFAYTLVAVICFGPAVGAAALLGEDGALVAAGLAVVGIVYFPAAVLSAALVHPPSAVAALNVPNAIRLIARTGSAYWLATVACVVLYVAETAAVAGVRSALESVPVPFLPRV
ncbi:MAG: hypothetical protein JNL38_27425, partial [Myxococcales bacterium]|nr:hypothetical protein [Myxococcales bacterium]